MKKKIITLVLSLVLCLGIVPSMTACGKKSDVSVMLMINSKENTFYSQHFKSVGSEMGISIGYTGRAAANYYDQLSVANQKGDMPDIFYVRPSDIRQFIAEGLIADISEEIKEYTRLNAMNEFARGLFMYDTATKTFGEGKTYALPKDLSVKQLGYNVELVYKNRTVIWDAFKNYQGDYPKYESGDNAGKFKLPWDMDWSKENYTWSQYLTMTKALSAAGGQDGPSSHNNKPVYGCDFPNYEILVWSFGDELVTNGHVNVDKPAFKQAAQYLAELKDSGAANRDGASYDNFVTLHNVCFYSEMNSFDIIDFDNSLPISETIKTHDNRTYTKSWDVMPFPVADPQGGKYARVDGQESDPTEWMSVITTAGYAVSSKCTDKKRAVEIIMTLYRENVQTNLVQTLKLQLPLFEGAVLDSFLSTEFDTEFSPLNRKVYMDVINGTNGDISAVYTCYDSQWHDRIDSSLLEYVYIPGNGKTAAGEYSDRYGDGAAFSQDVQSVYDQFNANKA